MADEKINVSPEEKKAPEAPAPSGPGDPPAPKHTEGPAVPGGDQTAPAHVEPAMPEKTEGPIKPEQSVIPGMGEDTPAPSSKVINLSDIQAADKGGKEASTPTLENTRIEELDAERQKQLRLVADLTANSVSASQIDSITGYLDDWESVSFDDKRKVVDILISQIDATSESVTIHWKI